MGFLLYIIATILFLPLTILNIIVVVWKNAKVGSFWKTVNGYFKTGAVDIDKFGNHNFRTLWNVILRKSGGYQFGHKEETISSALGKNQRDKKLSFVGCGLANLLDWFDKEHCKNSINNDIK